MNSIQKGMVVMLGFFEGTPMELGVKRENYAAFSKKIKEGGREQIEALLPELGSKEKVADFLYATMQDYHNQILKISTHVSEEVLERAWGANYKKRMVAWMLNISSLLHMKRIKNDEMNGWVLMDHNSTQIVKDTGVEIVVGGNGASLEKLQKKANALLALNKK